MTSAFASKSPGVVGERKERALARSPRGSAALGLRLSAASMLVRRGHGNMSGAPRTYAGRDIPAGTRIEAAGAARFLRETRVCCLRHTAL